MNRARFLLLILFIAVTSFALYIVLALRTPNIPVDSNAQYFAQQIWNSATERVGQPIEGFTPEMLLDAYPTLVAEDFDHAQAMLGEYRLVNGALTYFPDQQGLRHSAERTVSYVGMGTVLQNVAFRLQLPVDTLGEIDIVIAAIIDTSLDLDGETTRRSVSQRQWYFSRQRTFSFAYPPQMHVAYEDDSFVVFTEDARQLASPLTETSLASLSSYISVSLGTLSDVTGGQTLDEWLAAKQLDSRDPHMISFDKIKIRGNDVVRIIMAHANKKTAELQYVFVAAPDKVFHFIAFPYETSSSIETVVAHMLDTLYVKDSVSISQLFDKKIVYTTDTSHDSPDMQRDCALRNGVFNECGSVCDQGVAACIDMCAFTCELP